MASSVFVLDSSFKRTQVKVTPGKALREVLEEACKARKLNPEEYTLKTQNNKNLDLSQPFRLSGLSAGAKLQLTQASKSPGVVNVALQLPDSEGGGRLSDKFPSSTSLWLVLRKYEDAVAGSTGKKLNLTQRGVPSSSEGAGRLMYEQPCLHLLSRNLESFTELQKTLAQLGLNGGSVLIRLTFRATETPLEDAMQEMSGYFNDVGSVPAGIGSSASQGPEGAQVGANRPLETSPDAGVENSVLPTETEVIPGEQPATSEPPSSQATENPILPSSSNTAPPPSNDTAMSTDTITPTSSNTNTNTINGISVFRPPSSSTPAAARQIEPESTFEPTVDHAKSHQAALQHAGKNKRLLSDKEIEEQDALKAEKLAEIKSVVVRVRYPDQSQIETTVDKDESGAGLYARVMETLAAAPEPFELRYYPSSTTGIGRGNVQETLPNSSKTLLVRDCGFRGKVLVTLVWSPDASMSARQGPSLKEEFRNAAQDLKVELATQQADGEAAHESAMKKIDKAPEDQVGGEGKGKGDLESKMKKFLGFNKKK